ncbi:MAG: hypothetical protein D6704_08585 [Nitrospirae bacterium]|nr:MAG: hypothetical protein D6704_08585 [Nitrospirota bacterium]
MSDMVVMSARFRIVATTLVIMLLLCGSGMLLCHTERAWAEGPSPFSHHASSNIPQESCQVPSSLAEEKTDEASVLLGSCHSLEALIPSGEEEFSSEFLDATSLQHRSPARLRFLLFSSLLI